MAREERADWSVAGEFRGRGHGEEKAFADEVVGHGWAPAAPVGGGLRAIAATPGGDDRCKAKQGEKFQNLQSRIDQLEHALSTSKIVPSPTLDGAATSVASSTPRSPGTIQGYSPPVAQSIEVPPRKSSVVAEVRNVNVSLPTIGLSLSISHLGHLAGQPSPLAFRSLEYDDSEEFIESELHQEELIYSCGDPTRVDLSIRSCWAYQQAFVKNILPWFPLFSQDVCAHHVTVAQENHFSPACPSTSLALYILALGAFSRADQIYGDDPREFPGLDYFAAARNIPERSGIKHAIEMVQTQILRTMYLCLCMRPLAAANSIMSASRLMVSLLHLKRHLHNDPYFKAACHRAYWTCFILEKELLPYSGGCTAGFVELHEIISLPRPGHDEPGMLWMLSAIALRRIFANISGTESDPDWQPIIMNELNAQLAKWYDALPPAIRFTLGSSAPVLDPQKAFLRAQYYSVCFVSYWSPVVRFFSAPPENEEQSKYLIESSTKCLQLAMMYINAMESSILDRHVLLFANLIGYSLSLFIKMPGRRETDS
ncbi:hypothetical protein NA57DRAFT_79876 [Rhizodiscina lignyota]|uniref:Transcription factor domain-containing protein n=1 Tax=Rhizodiscina lignyota TaxID=1504668 RepID=A0A9P4M1K0_9PEZI|nr:hypothetical protein NA57DRAFT_79876 [Rhizodiscina lignyota]